MKVNVYLDILFLVQYVMNTVVLLLYCIYRQRSLRWWQVGVLSAIITTVDCFLLLSSWNQSFGRGFVMFLEASLCSWAIRRRYVRKYLLYDILLFMGISAGVQGILSFLLERGRVRFQQMNTGQLVAFASILVFLLSAGIRYVAWLHRRERNQYEVKLCRKGESIQGVGFMDTGNQLIHPITKKGIIVASFQTMYPILPQSMNDYLTGIVETDQTEDTFCLIPCHSVTGTQYLPACQFDRMCIRQGNECYNYPNVWVAVTKEQLSGRRDYDFLLCEEYSQAS